MEAITISKHEYENLKKLAESARALNDFFLPKVNYGASFLDSNALGALSDFSVEIRKATERENSL